MVEPRWLSDTEQGQWRTFLDTIRRLSRALERQLLADAGLPHAYYGILVSLSEAPRRRMRMGDLAADLGFSPSRLSHAVARMEQAGWVERLARPSSGRERDARLTDEGVAVLEKAAPGHVALVRELLFDRLDPAELAQLQAVCDRIAPALGACPAETECPAEVEDACLAEPEDACEPDAAAYRDAAAG